MPRGDKSKYSDKQKRKAEHIEEGYEKRGLDEKEAERRALGYCQQGIRRRQQVGERTGHAGHERFKQEGGKDGGRSRGVAPGKRAVGLGQEGGRDTQAKSGVESEMTASRTKRGVGSCLTQSNADSRVTRRAFADGMAAGNLSPSCDRPDG